MAYAATYVTQYHSENSYLRSNLYIGFGIVTALKLLPATKILISYGLFYGKYLLVRS